MLLTFWRWLWRERDQGVSLRWRNEQARIDGQCGIEGVSIRWPIRKITNEAAIFNRAKLKKRA